MGHSIALGALVFLVPVVNTEKLLGIETLTSGVMAKVEFDGFMHCVLDASHICLDIMAYLSICSEK